MNNKRITLEEFRETVDKIAHEVISEFPKVYFNYAGIAPVNDRLFRYNSTPTNTEVFAATGGDGVHYSILEITADIQPVIMTVPMNFGESMKDYNWIIGENLYEFLSIGHYNGWFPLEQLCYTKESIIEYYSKESTENDFRNGADLPFIKKLVREFGVEHIPLNLQRLQILQDRYFEYLEFNTEVAGTSTNS